MRNKNAKIPDVNKMFTCPGDVEQVTYSAKVLPDGTIQLTPNGIINIPEYIDSFKETTDISYILKRMATGDESVLHRSVPIYGDFTEMPSSPMEAMQMMIDAEMQFNRLPIDVRNGFNNSYLEWLNSAVKDPDSFKNSFGVDGTLKTEEVKEVIDNAES